jgi:hypothetical protein
MVGSFDNIGVKKRGSLLIMKPDILIEVLHERNLLDDLMNLDNLGNNANRREDLNEVSIEELLRRVREHRGDHL